MDFSLSLEQELYRDGVRAVCAKFPESYWRQVDSEKRYPDDFVRALTDGGWLSVVIPTDYGGGGARRPQPRRPLPVAQAPRGATRPPAPPQRTPCATAPPLS